MLLGGPGASLGCLGCLGLPAAFLGLSWRSPGARLVHSWAVVVQVPLVVVVVVVVALSLSLSSSLSGGPEVVDRVGGSGSVGCWSGSGGWGSLG